MITKPSVSFVVFDTSSYAPYEYEGDGIVILESDFFSIVSEFELLQGKLIVSPRVVYNFMKG